MNSDIFITVFTPTYNRGYIIDKLYNSLKNQTINNFEWLVVDDGSDDKTEELFEKWLREENKFKIIYKKTSNQGLNRAVNLGIKLASGNYFFRIDSDDFLKNDCIEKLYSWIENIKGEENVIGVAGIRGTIEDMPIKGVYPNVDEKLGYRECTDLERAKYDLDADMYEAYKIEILRENPLPVWEDEKFCPEQVLFNELALKGYKIRFYNQIIATCEYRTDGLTKGSQKLIARNPMGYAMMYNHMLKYGHSFKQNINTACQFIALCILGKNKRYILSSNKKFLTMFCLPIGFVLYKRRKIQFKEFL